MARNAEKAMTALARFRQAQLEEGKVKERRPFLASECSDLPKAEKWRRQIISEISKKVAQIQNAGLGEFRIRDLNDEINKLLREKGHWEVRIKELGGADYGRVGPKMLDHEGKEVPGNRGYKYFAVCEAVDRWRAELAARLAGGQKEEEEEEEESIYAVGVEEVDELMSEQQEEQDGAESFIAHVPVPSQKERPDPSGPLETRLFWASRDQTLVGLSRPDSSAPES
ncbi:hypothetical protein CRUP_032252, partial [Coryphaenoides rupestris]